jgi:hypothetical protein
VPGDSMRWTTEVTFEGSYYYVRPTRITGVVFGVLEGEENSLWAKGFLPWHLKRTYPTNERQLRRVIARCDTWCAKRNVETMIAHDALSRLRSEKVLSS